MAVELNSAFISNLIRRTAANDPWLLADWIAYIIWLMGGLYRDSSSPCDKERSGTRSPPPGHREVGGGEYLPDPES